MSTDQPGARRESQPEGQKPEAGPPPSVSKLPLYVMGALVALAVLVVVALAIRGTTEYPAGSPERALQDYLNAALEGDKDDVALTITEEFSRRCLNEEDAFGDLSSIGFELDSIKVDGDIAVVEATTRRSSSGDPFDSSYRTGEADFSLRRVDGQWLVDEASWPWPMTRCQAGS